MNEPLKDQELLENFRVLYKNYAPALIFYAAKFVVPAAAEDLVQDVFLKVWNKRSFLFWEESLQKMLRKMPVRASGKNVFFRPLKYIAAAAVLGFLTGNNHVWHSFPAEYFPAGEVSYNEIHIKRK